MILLQAKVVETATTVVINYGAIGALLVMCIIAIVYMHKSSTKQFEKQDTRYAAEVSDLRLQMNKYITEDRAKMLQVIENNTLAFKELKNELHFSNNKP